jgi:FtsP/CotA-like multicopper oxidase with cupredoxin domain
MSTTEDNISRLRVSRRSLLRSAGMLAAVLGSGGAAALLSSCINEGQVPPAPGAVPTAGILGAAPSASATSTPMPAGDAFVPDMEIALKATTGQASILPGEPTAVWTYQAEVLQGDPSNLQTLQDTYLGPIIRVRKGQKIRVHLTNDLPEETIVHWHGLLVPSRMDGHPRDAIGPGQAYIYEYEVLNRAGTYWFHPHPHGLTGPQVYAGMAGLFLISDDEEDAAGLPSGEYDVPLVIQDRTFDADNQLVYLSDDHMGGMGGMGMSMDRMMGFLGERILVNGRPDFVLPVATRPYRLRLLNGSNSRIYKLAWSDGTPLTVIATDGGLLESPVERQYVTLGPAERADLWADFGDYPVGTELTLESLEFIGAEGDELVDGTGQDMGHGMGHGTGHGAGSGMGPGMMAHNPALPNGAPFPVMTVRVERQEREALTLPASLSTVTRYRLEDAVNGADPRAFGLSMRHMTWLLNGRVFEMDEVAENEIVKLSTLEAWEFVNELNPGEMMEQMGMAHPMHIHGVQFQVVERQVLPELKAGWDSVQEGYVDEGWKDTVLVMPGERVKLLMRFEHPDLFVYHCHNLEHEDMGMMRNYRVMS